MIFERFSTEEEVRLYIANAMTAREEVPGVLMAITPGGGDMRRVYPTNNVNSTKVGEPILAEGSVTSEPNTGNVGGASPYASQEPTYEVEEV